jgi:predicted nuclease of predicted toxin-antitoxin system
VILVADESVDAPIVARLRREGHEVISIAESAVLVTADKDFGEMVYRQRRTTSGVVLLRLAGVPPAAKADMVAKVLREHGSELPGAVTVIGPGSVRIRHLLG